MKRLRRLLHSSQDLAIMMRIEILSEKEEQLLHSEANTSRPRMLIQALASTRLTEIGSKQVVQTPKWAQRKELICGELRRNEEKANQVQETSVTHIPPSKPEKVHHSVESTNRR